MSTPAAGPAGLAGLVDIAGNLTNKAFRDDLPAVLSRAAEAGVAAIVVAGISVATTRRGLVLAASPGPVRLVATAGIHPHHASEATPPVIRELGDLARSAVAVGECGLDYDRDFSPRDAQRRAFEAQLELAAELRLPVYLHERAATADFTAILARWRPRLARGGVVHCFTGDRAALEQYLALDLHVGITGWICDERRGTHLHELVRLVPAGRLLVETDAPYLLPRDLPGRPRSGRNEPAFVRHVAAAVAHHRGESLDELAAHTTRTAAQLFDLGSSGAGDRDHP